MPTSQAVSPTLVHGGTRLPAVVVRASELAVAVPIDQHGKRYVLILASEQENAEMPPSKARLWIEAGAAFVCAWGASCGAVERSFDHAAYFPEFGAPLNYTLMTTSHKAEDLDEALWFGFYSAFAPDDLPYPLSSVVVLVDSVSLEARSLEWIKTNRE